MKESKLGSLKNEPIIIGIVSVASPIPLFVFTVLWSWLWFLELVLACSAMTLFRIG